MRVRGGLARPLKGIAKVRPNWTLEGAWVEESTPRRLVIEWRTRSAGLGFLRFEVRGETVACEGAVPEPGFIRRVLLALEFGVPAEWPHLVRAHGGVDGLLAAVA